MYHKILVPLDGSPLSEAALEHVHQVAGRETEVLLVRVLDVVTAPAPVSASSEITPIPPLAASSQAMAVMNATAAKAFQDAEEHLNAKALALHGQVRATRSLVLGGGDRRASSSM
jgi:nucleotide-binding universal stress UspA family protein